MQKIAVFLDYANIEGASRKACCDINYGELLNYLANDGYVIRTKIGTIAGESYKCDFDVEITLDITNIALELKPDIFGLVSGDNDFVLVVMELRNKGICIEAASFESSMSSLLSRRCSGYINLDVLRKKTERTEENYHWGGD